MKNKYSTSGPPHDERQSIRESVHRANASRQSLKPVERSNQHRQPKTGGTGGHGKRSS